MDTASDMRPECTVVVVTGGDPPDGMGASTVAAGHRVVAADSGADSALALGLRVDEIVGDLDSVSEAGLRAVTHAGAAVEVHQPDKDATDLELALTAALRHEPTRIVVLGGLGGRADHELANLLLLTGDALADVNITLRSGRVAVHVVRPARPTTIRGTSGEIVSLLPVQGPVRGVTTDRLRWPLTEADLVPGTTLGVSNELVGDQASVTCTEGVLLVVQPGVPAALVPPRSCAPSSEEDSRDR